MGTMRFAPLTFLLLACIGPLLADKKVDPCQRQQFRSKCSDSSDPGQSIRSQFVLRYYRRGSECVSYPFGHCKADPDEPDLFKYKEECEQHCLADSTGNRINPEVLPTQPDTPKVDPTPTKPQVEESENRQNITIAFTTVDQRNTATSGKPKSRCFQQQQLARQNGRDLINSQFVPECNSDGTFRKLQCHTPSGYCWCADDEGIEVSNSRVAPGSPRPDCIGNNTLGNGGNQSFSRNGNSEPSKESLILPVECNVRPDPGPCNNYERRWAFNDKTQSCAEFQYGGCGGNGNNFYSKRECETQCSATDGVFCGKGATPLTDANGQKVRCETNECPKGFKCTFTPYFAACCPETPQKIAGDLTVSNETEQCLAPKDRGTCERYELRFYYNTITNECKYFFYGGCGGNHNNFQTIDECKRLCLKTDTAATAAVEEFPVVTDAPESAPNSPQDKSPGFVPSVTLPSLIDVPDTHVAPVLVPQPIPPDAVVANLPPVDVCSHPKDSGNCAANYTRWFFNKAAGTCEQFSYTGCKGNGNNFGSEQECNLACRDLPKDRCQHPLNAGPCAQAFVRWFFNPQSTKCETFTYGGCSGNGNNFGSKLECEASCRKDTRLSVNDIGAQTNDSCVPVHCDVQSECITITTLNGCQACACPRPVNETTEEGGSVVSPNPYQTTIAIVKSATTVKPSMNIFGRQPPPVPTGAGPLEPAKAVLHQPSALLTGGAVGPPPAGNPPSGPSPQGYDFDRSGTIAPLGPLPTNLIIIPPTVTPETPTTAVGGVPGPTKVVPGAATTSATGGVATSASAGSATTPASGSAATTTVSSGVFLPGATPERPVLSGGTTEKATTPGGVQPTVTPEKPPVAGASGQPSTTSQQPLVPGNQPQVTPEKPNVSAVAGTTVKPAVSPNAIDTQGKVSSSQPTISGAPIVTGSGAPVPTTTVSSAVKTTTSGEGEVVSVPAKVTPATPGVSSSVPEGTKGTSAPSSSPVAITASVTSGVSSQPQGYACPPPPVCQTGCHISKDSQNCQICECGATSASVAPTSGQGATPAPVSGGGAPVPPQTVAPPQPAGTTVVSPPTLAPAPAPIVGQTTLPATPGQQPQTPPTNAPVNKIVPVPLAPQPQVPPSADDALKCSQPADPGPCTNFVSRFFFNTATRRCETFQYGGCAGNRNHFYSLDQCDVHCVAFGGPNVAVQTAPGTPPVPNSPAPNVAPTPIPTQPGPVQPVPSQPGWASVQPGVVATGAPVPGWSQSQPAPTVSGLPPVQPLPVGISPAPPVPTYGGVSPAQPLPTGQTGYPQPTAPIPVPGYSGVPPAPQPQPTGYGPQPSVVPPAPQPTGYGPQPTGYGPQPSVVPPAPQPTGYGVQPSVVPGGYGVQPSQSPSGYGVQPPKPQSPSGYGGGQSPSFAQPGNCAPSGGPSFSGVSPPSSGYGSPPSNSYGSPPSGGGGGYGGAAPSGGYGGGISGGQPPKLRQNIPQCPNGLDPMKYSDCRPVLCLPGKDQCPPNSNCYFNGLDFFCCPTIEDPFESSPAGGYGGGGGGYGGDNSVQTGGYGGQQSGGYGGQPSGGYGGQQGGFSQAPSGFPQPPGQSGGYGQQPSFGGGYSQVQQTSQQQPQSGYGNTGGYGKLRLKREADSNDTSVNNTAPLVLYDAPLSYGSSSYAQQPSQPQFGSAPGSFPQAPASSGGYGGVQQPQPPQQGGYGGQSPTSFPQQPSAGGYGGGQSPTSVPQQPSAGGYGGQQQGGQSPTSFPQAPSQGGYGGQQAGGQSPTSFPQAPSQGGYGGQQQGQSPTSFPQAPSQGGYGGGQSPTSFPQQPSGGGYGGQSSGGYGGGQQQGGFGQSPSFFPQSPGGFGGNFGGSNQGGLPQAPGFFPNAPGQSGSGSGGFVPQAECSLARDAGPCKGSHLRWFLDTATGTCRLFYYGGCGGNKNNYPTRSDCEQWCLGFQPGTTRTGGTPGQTTTTSKCPGELPPLGGSSPVSCGDTGGSVSCPIGYFCSANNVCCLQAAPGINPDDIPKLKSGQKPPGTFPTATATGTAAGGTGTADSGSPPGITPDEPPAVSGTGTGTGGTGTGAGTGGSSVNSGFALADRAQALSAGTGQYAGQGAQQGFNQGGFPQAPSFFPNAPGSSDGQTSGGGYGGGQGSGGYGGQPQVLGGYGSQPSGPPQQPGGGGSYKDAQAVQAYGGQSPSAGGYGGAQPTAFSQPPAAGYGVSQPPAGGYGGAQPTSAPQPPSGGYGGISPVAPPQPSSYAAQPSGGYGGQSPSPQPPAPGGYGQQGGQSPTSVPQQPAAGGYGGGQQPSQGGYGGQQGGQSPSSLPQPPAAGGYGGGQQPSQGGYGGQPAGGQSPTSFPQPPAPQSGGYGAQPSGQSQGGYGGAPGTLPQQPSAGGYGGQQGGGQSPTSFPQPPSQGGYGGDQSGGYGGQSSTGGGYGGDQGGFGQAPSFFPQSPGGSQGGYGGDQSQTGGGGGYPQGPSGDQFGPRTQGGGGGACPGNVPPLGGNSSPMTCGSDTTSIACPDNYFCIIGKAICCPKVAIGGQVPAPQGGTTGGAGSSTGGTADTGGPGAPSDLPQEPPSDTATGSGSSTSTGGIGSSNTGGSQTSSGSGGFPWNNGGFAQAPTFFPNSPGGGSPSSGGYGGGSGGQGGQQNWGVSCPDGSPPLIGQSGQPLQCGAGYDGTQLCPQGFFCSIQQGTNACCALTAGTGGLLSQPSPPLSNVVSYTQYQAQGAAAGGPTVQFTPGGPPGIVPNPPPDVPSAIGSVATGPLSQSPAFFPQSPGDQTLRILPGGGTYGLRPQQFSYPLTPGVPPGLQPPIYNAGPPRNQHQSQIVGGGGVQGGGYGGGSQQQQPSSGPCPGNVPALGTCTADSGCPSGQFCIIGAGNCCPQFPGGGGSGSSTSGSSSTGENPQSGPNIVGSPPGTLPVEPVKQRLAVNQQRETFDRRNETIALGPSPVATTRQADRSTICGQQPEPGEECAEGKKGVNYYFNDRERRCKPFWYNGCFGGDNRFTSRTKCLEVCLGGSESELNTHR